MLLVLTNICRGCDITSVTRCGADLETITSPLMFSDQPNSGLRIVYPSLLTVFRKQDVWKTRGDLRQQGGLPDWPGPWRGDPDLSCCLFADIFLIIRSRPCSGGSLTKTITSPRPPQTRAWRRSWREYQTLSRYYPHLLISGWVFIDPQFPIFLITPRQFTILQSTAYFYFLRLLSPNCIFTYSSERPERKNTTLQTSFICTFSLLFLSFLTFQFV